MPASRRSLSPRKQPTQQRSREMVELLLKSTTRILVKDGLTGFNTNKLARVAGVSVGSVYQYFPNKDSLLSALIEAKVAADVEFFIEWMKDAEGWSGERRFEELLLAGIELHRRDHKLMKVIFAQLGSSGQLGLVERTHDRLFDMIRAMIREKRSLGEADLNERTYVVGQLVLAIWHSQVEKDWMKLDARSVARRALSMIQVCIQDGGRS